MKDGLTADFTVEQPPNSINDFQFVRRVVKTKESRGLSGRQSPSVLYKW